MRANTSCASSPSSTRLAKAPSRPQSMVTKLAADGSGLEAVGARDGADDAARPRDACHGIGEVFLILERGERADLSDAVDAVVIADLLEGADDARLAEAVADACAGETVGLGEGAKAQHLRITDVDGQQLVGRRGVAIGLVEAEQHAAWQSAR